MGSGHTVHNMVVDETIKEWDAPTAVELTVHAIAAVLPPVPSGFWDRTPKPTPGRLRRLLAQADFPTLVDDERQLRKKN